MKLLIFLSSILVGFAAVAQTSEVKEVFGGAHVQIFVYENSSAVLHFECANAEVQAGRWQAGQSRVSTVGLYEPMNQSQRAQKAVFKANVDVATGQMTLSVKVGSQRPIVYQLMRGQRSNFLRCR